MVEFNRETILRAIERIDAHPDLRNGRGSIEYDLKFNEKTYPPILILSEASKLLGGAELKLSDFGNSIRQPFEILKGFGFNIQNKKEEKHTDVKVWIEKTLVVGRPDRTDGDYAFGKRLWSPQTDKRGADIYSAMRNVSENDVILHLTDNSGFTAVSKAAGKFYEGQGAAGTEWEGPAYIIELKNFIRLQPLARNKILKSENKKVLEQIKEKNRVFYNSELNLNQGAYLTEGPIELIDIINEAYYKEYKQYLPYLPTPSTKTNSTENLIGTEQQFKISSFIVAVQNASLFIDKEIIARFICSLLTKPFVILTGLSGSGKTKLAQAFALWISESSNQYCLVPVGADWINREPLLGFPNSLDIKSYLKPDNGILDLIIEASREENRAKPYFLILDEMNLSHVERYFADFLSVMESQDRKGILLHSDSSRVDSKNREIPNSIKLPANLFIIGTVNIDETTYMFSPKVLDRANVIEFRVTQREMEVFFKGDEKISLENLEAEGAAMANSFSSIATNEDLKVDAETKKEITKTLLKFFYELKKVGAEFGYRSAKEILRFGAIVETLETGWKTKHIIDTAIMQKLLPKLHGSRSKISKVLTTLGQLCLEGDKDVKKEIFDRHNEVDFENEPQILYRVSLEKISRMHKNVVEHGFTSYAEA